MLARQNRLRATQAFQARNAPRAASAAGWVERQSSRKEPRAWRASRLLCTCSCSSANRSGSMCYWRKCYCYRTRVKLLPIQYSYDERSIILPTCSPHYPKWTPLRRPPQARKAMSCPQRTGWSWAGYRRWPCSRGRRWRRNSWCQWANWLARSCSLTESTLLRSSKASPCKQHRIGCLLITGERQ